MTPLATPAKPLSLPSRALGVAGVLITSPEDGGGHQYSLSVLRTLARLDAESDALTASVVPYPGTGQVPDLPLPVCTWQVPATRDVELATWSRRAWSLAARTRAATVLREMRNSVRHRLQPPPDPDVLRHRPDLSRWMDDEGLDWMLLTASNTIGFEARRPFVSPIHDLQHRLQPHFPEVSAHGEWQAREYLFRNLCRYATLLFVDSEVGREDALTFYGPHGLTEDRVAVLPFEPAPYLDPDVPEPTRAAVRSALALPERYLLYPAQFWPHKNHQRLVRAIGQLRQEGETVHVVLCGSHTTVLRERTFHQVRETAVRLGVGSQVHTPGYVPDAWMSALYAEAAGVVMPTFFGPTNIPVLEGWAFGKPVLTSDIRGIREQAGDAALLVDPTSVEAIADGVRRLWTDAALGADLVARGTRRLAARPANAFGDTLRTLLLEANERVRSGDAPFSRPR